MIEALATIGQWMRSDLTSPWLEDGMQPQPRYECHFGECEARCYPQCHVSMDLELSIRQAASASWDRKQ